MKLSQLGEFGLIELIKKTEKTRSDTVIGIGDDCAVLQIPSTKSQITNASTRLRRDLDETSTRPRRARSSRSVESLGRVVQSSRSASRAMSRDNTKYQNINGQKYLLITTDAVVENVHFKRKGTSFFALGQKAMIANISDISAMGGLPTHAVITAGLPKDLDLKSIKELYRGIDAISRKNGIDIVGGDTVTSPKEIFISITLLGEVEKENLLTRSGAKPGDLIYVTGEFGGHACANYKLQTTNYNKTRLNEARVLAKARVATSMIDSSDGLVRSVLELCKASKVGAVIEEQLVPKDKKAILEQALYGGEEYELVFTIHPKMIGKIPKQLKKRLTFVGTIVSRSQGVHLICKDGRMKSVKGGYEHFIK